MGPLSDVLSLLKPRRYSSGGMDLGGDWSVLFPRYQGIKCYAVVAGQCWLAVEGVENAVFLDTGDCFVLPSGRPFRLASDLALDSVVTGHWRNWDAESGCHGDKLTNSDDSITTITVSVGYESESAFGKTFKRVMGCSPWQFSRGPMPTQLKLRPGTRNGPLSG